MLDGAWGTMLQGRKLEEADYRGERFAEHTRDLKGDPDLLNLTQPEIVLDVHRQYLAAGADITTTNTFTATSIGQADYGLEDAVYDMNFAGASLARQAADEAGGRFVAGSLGPAQPDALALAARRGSRVPLGDLRRGARLLRGADPRPARRRRRLPPPGDDHRRAQRQGRDRGRAGDRAGAAALDLRDDHRPLGPHARRADARGVLALDRARESAHRRPQLLAGRDRDAAARGGARAHRRHVHELLSERGPAERLRRLRRAAARHEPAPQGAGGGRTRERRRRLLRHDARAHAPDRRGRLGPAAAQGSRPPPRDALLRARAVRALRGHDLHRDRRADERDRLGALPQPDRGRRLPGRHRRGARAGARRREHPRREHGRRPARLGAGDDDVPEHPRDRARGGAPARDDRQLALVGHPGGAALRPGQADRELDLAEGGGGGLPRQGARGPQVRRRARRDGLRRAGPGRHGRAQGRDLRPRLRPARRRGDRARGSDLRPERARGRDRHGGAQRVRQGVHRRGPADQGALPGRADLRRDLEPLVRVPRQRARARGDPLGVPLLRDPRRPRHGDRERRPASGLRGHPAGSARARRGHHLRPPSRCDRAHGRVRRHRPRRGQEARARPLLARGPRRGAALVRARPWRRRLHRGGHGRGAPVGRAPARRDRGPAHEWDGNRGRPLRLREDVPPAGREERTGDEARRCLPRAVHGGRARGGRLQLAGEARDRDGQGRRPRHRQEHRRSRPRLQQLRGDRPRRHGAERPDPRHGRGGELRPGRPLRSDHAVARRDGARGRGDGAPRARHSAPDRRRDHVEAAHGRADRARVLEGDDARARCVACRADRLGPARPRAGGHPRHRDARRPGTPAARSTRSRRGGRSFRSPRLGRGVRRSSGAPRICPRRRSPACARSSRVWPRCASTSTGSSSSTPGR